MFKTELLNTLKLIVAVFYRLGFWDIKDSATIYETARKFFHIIYFISFVISLATSVLTSNKKYEVAYLSMAGCDRVFFIARVFGNSCCQLLLQSSGLSSDDRVAIVFIFFFKSIKSILLQKTLVFTNTFSA